MSDPLGLIGTSIGIGRDLRPQSAPGRAPGGGESEFKRMLQDQIEAVNQLQLDADAAVEDLSTGRRHDLEAVMTATQKADTAFKMLLQVRNKVMEAYEEVKQIRV